MTFNKQQIKNHQLKKAKAPPTATPIKNLTLVFMYRSGQTTNLSESLEYSWDFFNKTLLTEKKTTKLMTVNIALLIYLTSLRFENAKTNCIPRHKSSPNTLKIKYKKWWTCTLYWRHSKTSCTLYMLVAYEEYACVIHVLAIITSKDHSLRQTLL